MLAKAEELKKTVQCHSVYICANSPGFLLIGINACMAVANYTFSPHKLSKNCTLCNPEDSCFFYLQKFSVKIGNS